MRLESWRSVPSMQAAESGHALPLVAVQDLACGLELGQILSWDASFSGRPRLRAV